MNRVLAPTKTPPGGSEEEHAKNLGGGTGAATIGNCEHFWCSWNSISNHYFAVVMKDRRLEVL